MKLDVFGVKTQTQHQDANLTLPQIVRKRPPLSLPFAFNLEAVNCVTNSRDVPGVIPITDTVLTYKEAAVSSPTDAHLPQLTRRLTASLLTEAPLLVVCSW